MEKNPTLTFKAALLTALLALFSLVAFAAPQGDCTDVTITGYMMADGMDLRDAVLVVELENNECLELIDRLSIKTAGTAIPMAALSGGNQQKVLFGRSLRLEPKVLVLDEPTSGIDVHAKEQILQLIDDAARGGTAVLVVSTDTDELVRVSHRILVMVGGKIVDELSGADMTAENVEHTQLQTAKVTAR